MTPSRELRVPLIDMGVSSNPRSPSSAPDAADPSDDELDSGWDDEPALATASTSIPPATEAVDSDWADDHKKPGLSPSSVARAKPAFVPPAPAKLTSATSTARSPSSPSVPPASTRAPVTTASVKSAPLAASRPSATSTPSPPRSTTPSRAVAPQRPSVRPSSTSGTRPAIQAKPLTASHPPPESAPVDAAPSLTATAVVPPEALPDASEAPRAATDIAPPAFMVEAPSVPAVAPDDPFTSAGVDFAKPSVPPVSEAALTTDPGTLRPSEVARTPSIPIPARRGRARYVQAAALAGVFALAGIAWLKLRPQAGPEARPPAAAARAPAPEKAPALPATPQKAAEPAAGEAPKNPDSEAPAPDVSAAAAPAASAGPDLTSAFAAALSATPGAIAVMVRVKPAGSIIFDHGKRIGTDVVHVNVEPGGKKNLVALLDGYIPRRFTVDGSLNSVSIELRPALTAGGAAPAAPTSNPMAPAAQTAPRPATPAKPAAQEAFDPSRDVGAL